MFNQIFKLIEDKKLSLTEFAAQTGISPAALTQLKNNEGNLSITNIMKIKNRWNNISLDWLIFGKGNMYEQINDSQPADLFPELSSTSTNTGNYEQSSIAKNVNTKQEPNGTSNNENYTAEPKPAYKFPENQNIQPEQPKIIEKIVEKILDKKIEKIIVLYDNNSFEEISALK